MKRRSVFRHQDTVTDHSLGSVLKAARVARNISQREVAFRLNLSVKYISCIERNNRIPTFPTLLAILKALDHEIGVWPKEHGAVPADEDIRVFVRQIRAHLQLPLVIQDCPRTGGR